MSDEPRSFKNEDPFEREEAIIASLREEIARARDRVRQLRRTMSGETLSDDEPKSR